MTTMYRYTCNPVAAAAGLAFLASAYGQFALAQVYIPEGDFSPRVQISAFAPSATPALSESDSITDPAHWQNHGYAVGVGCRENGQIPPPPRDDLIICTFNTDSAHAGVEWDVGRIRIGADTSFEGESSAAVEVRDYVTISGPAPTVQVTWTFNVEGSIERRLQGPLEFTENRVASASLDTWVQVAGVFTESSGDDLGIGVRSSGSARDVPGEARVISSSDQVVPLFDFQGNGNVYQGDLTYSLAGLRNSSVAFTAATRSVHVYPSPAGPIPPAITVELPTGTPLPVVISANANSQCFTLAGTCVADADFGNTIHIVASVPNGFTLTSQGGFSYTGQTEPPAPANPGTLQFTESGGSVEEGVGTLTLQVTRAGGADGEVSARVVTRASGSAAAAADFTAVDTFVTFADGDTTPKSVSIPILDDQTDEPNEDFAVDLTNVAGGATLGTVSTTTISIRDNDATPGPGATSGGGGGSLGWSASVALSIALFFRWFALRAGAGSAVASRKRARSAVRR